MVILDNKALSIDVMKGSNVLSLRDSESRLSHEFLCFYLHTYINE